MKKRFYKCTPFNFVPVLRTPWAGTQISLLKKKYFPDHLNKIPELIGESWEVSTDNQFPSQIEIETDKYLNLTDLLKITPQSILGQKTYQTYGNHFPLLLKWLEANDFLSVQLHPANSNPMLKENECGKPEAWLVLNVQENAFVYLGFKDNLSQEYILKCLKNDEPDKCLYKYKPKKYDLISIPPGCVHAIGPGVLVAEPQYVLPYKIAKTWRISDWKRLYDDQGKKSSTGKPRELHTEESFSSINWKLAQGQHLEKELIRNLKSGETFSGDKNNPFAVTIFVGSGKHIYSHMVAGSFSLFTVWGGQVTLSTPHENLILKGGESGFICAETNPVELKLEDLNESASIAFFALNDDFC